MKMMFVIFILTALVILPANADVFTIAAIPDTQNYVDEKTVQPAGMGILQSETAAIVLFSQKEHIVFISHLGDIVQHQGQYPNEWSRAVEGMEPLIRRSRIPLSITQGNHDYDRTSDHAIRGCKFFLGHFGPDSEFFKNKPWYGGAFTPDANEAGASSWQTFKAGKWQFLHIALEMEPSDATLQWAQSVIDSHRNWPTIISTHQYLSWKGTLLAEHYRGKLQRNTPAQVWDKLISRNPQVFMVLCGHNFKGAQVPASRRIDKDLAGRDVWQILSDYQDCPGAKDPNKVPGGGGWIRFMEFDTDANQVHVRTYSSLFARFSTDQSLTDSGVLAKSLAPFNYDESGALRKLEDPQSSDFILNIDFEKRFTLK
jgi:hypothetical protein